MELLMTIPERRMMPVRSPKVREVLVKSLIESGRKSDDGIVRMIKNERDGFSLRAVRKM